MKHSSYDISQWLQILDGECKEGAIAYWNEQGAKRLMVGNFKTAFSEAFNWSKTPEGTSCWSYIASNPQYFVQKKYRAYMM
ncbi:hypothetical protein [Dinghuibacter silviterrae]|uniref:hypothetical protein n=1 Tax=Dinghuibacter silviterrae TaxID=1539049 RepID=UPI001063E925|nr:hypothetical protein [Dinghuibacter silviterrae]